MSFDLENALQSARFEIAGGKEAFRALMKKVYVWMALALFITGFTAYTVANNEALLQMIFGSRLSFWGLLIAELALVWYVSARIMSLSLSTATVLFVVYSVLNGATMASIFLVYTGESVGSVFAITGGLFAAMAFIGQTTKVDLTGMGNILRMVLIGVVIASVVNMFVGSSGFSLMLSYVCVILFTGLTVYDTQKIKQMFDEYPVVDDNSQKLALMGALSLYLDFINLFMALLRILGDRK